MNLALHIAKRYLFSKKSHNVINIISMISVCGIVVATIAMVCTMSVFNGFTNMVSLTFNAFDPDLEISAKEGKVFVPNNSAFEKVKNLPEIEVFSEALEENALLKLADRQEPIVLRGVSKEYQKIANMDTLLLDGKFQLREGDIDYGNLGAGLATHMGTRAGFFAPLEIFMPKRKGRVNVANPASTFSRREFYLSGVFSLNQSEYDEQLCIVSIDLIRDLLQYDNEVSTLNLKLNSKANLEKVKEEIKAILGDSFYVKDRYEQQSNLYQYVNIEKWMTFFILIVITMIAIFNVIGSLSILVVEKKDDIKILQSMGASNTLISRIFLYEGWLITFLGSLLGLISGLAICLLQEHFGLLKLGEAGTAVIDAYPVSVLASDILLIFFTVNLIGFIAVLYPVINLKNNLKKERLN